MSKDRKIDWLSVEADYKPGVMTICQIGEKYGCHESLIRYRAKKDGWDRDLAERIRIKADELVRKESARAAGVESTNEAIVLANALHSADIQVHERKDVTKARTVAMCLLDELEAQVTDKDLYLKLGEIMDTGSRGSSKLVEAYNKVISFSGRTDGMKKLSDTLKTLIDLERKVYKIDDEASGTSTIEDFLKSIKK